MICTCIGNADYGTALEKVKSGELVELRFDLLNLTDEETTRLISEASRSIVSFHPRKGNDKERLKKLKKAILAGADFVDIEWDAEEEFLEEIVPFARGNECRVIISFYDMEKTPPKRELEHIVKECAMSGADIVKIVCMSNSREDNARLMSLYAMGKNIISIGLGTKGRITRVAALFAGAEFTYADMGKDLEAGDGRMTRAAIERICKMLGKNQE